MLNWETAREGNSSLLRGSSCKDYLEKEGDPPSLSEKNGEDFTGGIR